MAESHWVSKLGFGSVLVIGVLMVPSARTFLSVDAACAQSTATLSPNVGKNLQAASVALSRKSYAKAMSAVTAADSVRGKTEYDAYTIEQMRAAIATASGDHQNASRAYQALIASPRSSVTEKHQMLMALGTDAYSNKDYAKAVGYIKQYLKAAGPSLQMQTLLAQAYYLQGDFTNAATVQSAIVEADERAGRRPTENSLQFLATCREQAHDATGETHAYVLLAKYYSKPDYWARLVHDLSVQQKMALPLRFNLMRLLAVTGTMKTSTEWVDMAERAVQAGMPQLGLNLLDDGFKNGVLGRGSDTVRLQRLRALMVSRAKDIKAELPQARVRAKGDATGVKAVTTGYNMMLSGDVEAGLQLMQDGVAAATQDKKATSALAYAMALRDAGRLREAVSAFAQVKGDATAQNLAQLWAILSKGKFASQSKK